VSPRSKAIFRAAGYSLVAIAILSFALRLILKVREGHSLDTYRSGTLVEWSYGAALVTLIVLMAAGLAAGLVRVAGWMRERRELRRLVEANHPSANIHDQR
jgi:hypothetical protein